MACAGILYAPILGAYYPGSPLPAYVETYDLALFDLGYARDISALSASMVAAALSSKASQEEVINVIRDVDPNDFFKSRLIGRTAYRILKQARSIVYQTNQIQQEELVQMQLELPKDYPYDSLYFARTQKAYSLMDELLQDVPFHAGEIFLINTVALLFTEMDFQKSMEFVTNFGRDNDTVGALTGAILGAFHGYSALPEDLASQVLVTNRNDLEIDLEDLARQLTDIVYRRKG